MGTTEEGRDIVALAIADEATIKALDKHKDMLGAITDPRKTTEAQAQQLIKTASRLLHHQRHALAGKRRAEMLIELAYRLIVEETPFIQNVRNNVITLITPVIESTAAKNRWTPITSTRRARRRRAIAADVLG